MKRAWKHPDGGITIYFSLVMTVMTALICASIVSVKVSAGRMQAANAVDQALFSLFARYDRPLEEKFDLFFIHAGSGGGGPEIAAVVKEIEDAAAYILNPGKESFLFGSRNLLSLQIQQCGLAGYTLATDGGGAPFAAQAVDAVKDTAALAGISFLRDKIKGGDEANSSAAQAMQEAGEVSYSGIEQRSRDAREAEKERAEAAAENGEVYVPPEIQVPAGFQNPLPILERLKKLSLLSLVVPEERGISEKSANPSELVSGRNLAHGMGVIDTTSGTARGADGLAFKAYVASHYTSYMKPSEHSVLGYQKEYILFGKRTDEANLKAVVRRLMVLREAANAACLYTDPVMSGRLSETAFFIGSMLLIPEAAPLIKLLLAAGWAYVESLVDVRALLEGKRIPYIKRADAWQTELAALVESGGDLSRLTRDSAGGMNYDEYLAALMLVSGEKKLILRAMDMTESELRGMGREDFRLDSCIAAVKTHVVVESEGRVAFPVEMGMDYREL